VAVNSVYSFWWDVTKDWGLSVFSLQAQNGAVGYPSPIATPRGPSPAPSHNSEEFLQVVSDGIQNGRHEQVTDFRDGMKTKAPFGLRSTLLFPDAAMYYLAILLNFVLRFTWSLKLSSHLHTIAQLEHGVFIMEALELLRRWVWVFFRIEYEAVKRGVLQPLRRSGSEEESVPLRFRGIGSGIDAES